MSEMPSIQENLKRVWKNVDNIFLPNDSWWNDDDKCHKIQKKISYFNSDHQDDPQHIDQIYKLLSRGVNLTQAAIDWEHPAIGSEKNDTGKARGIQWRLVIAYSGFEITTKGLINKLEGQPYKEDFKSLINKCQSNLPNYYPLNSPDPDSSKSLEKWLTQEEKSIGKFLGLRNNDIKVIENWMLESHLIKTWEDALLLARAFRNCTTHGFLVPRKVLDWKLKPIFRVLTENLAEILIAALEKIES
ncbi:hypothetical protein [Limnoraphis robusta]|jgi:hypothetical protein|uniref:RiboL-PSP-HEPN domain-containing protein n=1 Tax=Limnoraphis robusta CS-951 TaxID=1637645 RepID=A0A0J9EUF6_9CYAN|nr:hypothetical protein [Limnoraphis robusta]KMW69913.1 hypothetical protein WN50_39450 [Limnoraphis robusta CS-951]